MCNQLVCEVCGGQGVPQREFNSYSVTLCNAHFNELHCELQKKKPRKALVKFHYARMNIRYGGEEEEGGLHRWMDTEHEYFLVTDGIVKGMRKEWDKKNKKKTSRPEPSNKGELAEKK